MSNDLNNFQTKELPQKIQEILITFGAKKEIGLREYLRTFNQSSLNNIQSILGDSIYLEVKNYLDCYLIHSKNKKIVITSGQKI